MEDNVQLQKQRNDEMLEQTVESALVGKPTIESVAGYPNAATDPQETLHPPNDGDDAVLSERTDDENPSPREMGLQAVEENQSAQGKLIEPAYDAVQFVMTLQNNGEDKEKGDEKSEQIIDALKHLDIADGDDAKFTKVPGKESQRLDFRGNGKPSETADESPNWNESAVKKETKPILNLLKTDDATFTAQKHHKIEEKAHINSAKDENGFLYYKCRFCGLTFNYMTTLKAHERVHDVIQPYTCNKCGEAFHFICELEYHAKSHQDQKGYRCECGRTFYQYTDLLYHKHPGEDDDNESCFSSAQPLLRSGTTTTVLPSATVPLQSSLSIAEFPAPEYVVEGYEPKHPLKVWSDVRQRPYICQYCSKSYPDSRGLAYHMYSHRGERAFNPRASRYLMCRNDNSYISPGAD